MTPELSIVMPCLNEARTVGTCVGTAKQFLERTGIEGEVIVADNGSSDGSQRIAEESGARVVTVSERGYGHALIEGIGAARGTYVIMADADDSYDLSSLDDFVSRLRGGDDLVMGNRFKGGIEKNAMPPLHRYLGNPLLSFLGRLFYGAPVGDFHAGMRGFNREKILALSLGCGGMEFASEMVVKAVLENYRISEVPIKLYPDGRDRPPHLNSWQDGWRHLRFLLIFTPRWLFVYPGLLLMAIGLLGTLALFPGPVTLGEVSFDIHTLLYCSAFIVLGLQMLYMGCIAGIVGFSFEILPRGRVNRLVEWFTLERGLIVGTLLFLSGLAWSVLSVVEWGETGFSTLEPIESMRSTIPAVTLLIVGVQTVIAALFVGLFDMYREQHIGRQ
jgi:hypothetical protein